MCLQQFTCTTDRPRTPGGRKLPHPRRWEWEAQSYLRSASQVLKSGDVLLVGENGVTISACAHMKLTPIDDSLEVFIAVAAVNISIRGHGGAVADELLSRCIDAGRKRASEMGRARLIVTGNIHVENFPSQRMVIRAGLEPVGLPVGDYQRWRLVLALR